MFALATLFIVTWAGGMGSKSIFLWCLRFYLVQIFKKKNSLSDVCRVLGPNEAPGVLELSGGADLEESMLQNVLCLSMTKGYNKLEGSPLVNFIRLLLAKIGAPLNGLVPRVVF